MKGVLFEAPFFMPVCDGLSRLNELYYNYKIYIQY